MMNAAEGEQEQKDLVTAGKVMLHDLNYWVIDSGAARHMSPRRDLFSHIEKSPIPCVVSATGEQVKVEGMGNVMFMGADKKLVGVKKVLYVPGLNANLISTRQLAMAGMDTKTTNSAT